MECPHCKNTSGQHKSGKTRAGSQRYRCFHCMHKYTPRQKPRGYPPEIRLQALRMYVDGMNFRRIERHLGVHHTTVMNWVKTYVAHLPEAPLPETLDQVELDELFTFIETKKRESTSSQQ